MTNKVSEIALLAAMAVSAGILISAAPNSAEAGSRAGCKTKSISKVHVCNFEQRIVVPPKRYYRTVDFQRRSQNFGPSPRDLPARTLGGDRGAGEGGGGDGGGGGGGAAGRSDIRLKRDIQAIGTLANGLTLYRFKYLWSDTDMVGVMAQEVLNVLPDAVITGEDGFYRVNYDKLGISMMTFEEWSALVAELDQLSKAA